MKHAVARAGMLLVMGFAIFHTSPAYPLGSFSPAGYTTTQSNCLMEAVSGQFSSTASEYRIKGTCYTYAKRVTGEQTVSGESTFDNLLLQAKIPWSAIGTYNPATKDTREQISLLRELPRARPDNPPLFQEVARVVTTMICAVDPWLEQSQSPCLKVAPQISGDVSVLNMNATLVQINDSYVVGVLYPPSEHVPRTSQMLPAQHAALQKQYSDYIAMLQRRAEQARQAPAPQTIARQVVFPSISSPTAGQHFFAQSVVSIKLAPPAGWKVAGYMVAIQKKDASGNWVNYVNIPIPAAQAESAGFTGFGSGGTAATKQPSLLTSPGSWRLAAQVTSPSQSGWSQPVEFVVSAPLVVSPSTVYRKMVK